MKNFVLPILFFAFLAFSQTATAQIDATINPIGLLFGDISAGADFALSEKFSIEGTLGYGSKSLTGSKWSNVPINAVGKYYLNPNRGADRFYLDLFARFINRSYKYDDTSLNANYKVTRVGLGFGLGYKVVAAGGFVFDINFGAGRALIDNAKYEDSNGNQQNVIDWPKLMFQGKLGIGYRFGGDKK